jgi:hypothetical protein
MGKPKLKTFQFDTVRVVEDNHPVPGQPPGLRRKHRDPRQLRLVLNLPLGPSFVFYGRGFYRRW